MLFMTPDTIWYGHRNIASGSREQISERVAELFKRIADEFSFEIEKMEVAPDHVHLFLNFPPRYSIAKVVGILKSISASEVFREYPEIKKELWGGELWEDGFLSVQSEIRSRLRLSKSIFSTIVTRSTTHPS